MDGPRSVFQVLVFSLTISSPKSSVYNRSPSKLVHRGTNVTIIRLTAGDFTCPDAGENHA
jgi:hypothetical protein